MTRGERIRRALPIVLGLGVVHGVSALWFVWNEAPGTGAAANTKEDGSYTLLAIRSGATRDLHGAPAGAYRVTISEPTIPIQASLPAEKGPDGGPPAAIGPPSPSRKRSAIPARYTNLETTPLRVEVPAEGGTLDLKVASRP